MEDGLIAGQPDRMPDALHSILMPARLVGDEAQQMPGVGLIRLGREDLPADLLGGLQPAGLMVLDRDCQCFGERCH